MGYKKGNKSESGVGATDISLRLAPASNHS